MDGLYLYNNFDQWTKDTGVLDGSGLTWVVRLPLNLVIVILSLIYGAFHGKEEANYGRD